MLLMLKLALDWSMWGKMGRRVAETTWRWKVHRSTQYLFDWDTWYNMDRMSGMIERKSWKEHLKPAEDRPVHKSLCSFTAPTLNKI